MEFFNGELAKEYLKAEKKREENERKTLRQRVINLGQEMVSLVKTNQIKLEHSFVVEDYYFLASDGKKELICRSKFMVFGPNRLGYSNEPEISDIYDGMLVEDGISAAKQMEDFINNFKPQQ